MTRRNPQRGSAMLVTLIIVAALLAGVAVLVSLQLTTTRSTAVTRSGLAALHCAEAGLVAARGDVGLSQAATNAHLTAFPGSLTQEPSFVTSGKDIDADGVNDVRIYVIDDDDEQPTTNRAVDANSRVWVISRCIKYPDTPKEVRELVQFMPPVTQYKWQDGGAFGNNNVN